MATFRARFTLATRTPDIVRSLISAILSPHLDDAVLSCWHLLAAPGEVRVINVFTGAPTGAHTPAWWDRFTGATDSGQRMHERVEEDRRALALVGCTPVNLGLLEDQYRVPDQPVPPFAAGIGELVEPGTRIYAPAALGHHADHLLVRAAALQLREAGFAVWLYADLPHAISHGWPTWVTDGGARGPGDLAAALWERSLAQTDLRPDSMAPLVHRLDGAAHARKLAAAQAYRTQFQAVTRFTGRPLTDREVLGYEVVWQLPSAAAADSVTQSIA